MSTDDTKAYPHVVIVERESGMSIAEFDRDTKPSPGEAAHTYAQRATDSEDVNRVIVAMRERCIERMRAK